MRKERSPEEGTFASLRADARAGMQELLERSSRDHKRVVYLLILGGAALRISQIFRSVVYDEAFTYVNYVTHPLRFIFSNYTYPDNHILHTVFVKGFVAVLGTHVWSMRLPALIAGVLVMPLFYAFARLMFNRYIAMITLAFVASSGALIEFSALARGYSFTWLFMVAAMLAGRYFVKKDNLWAAVLVAVFSTLAMWAVPTAVYGAMMVYLWLLMYLIQSYQSTLRRRLMRLLLSFGAFFLLTLLVYTPVIVVHSVDQLVNHPTLGENNWDTFLRTHQDKAFELWAYLNDTAATWISICGFAGVFYAAYISTKYRIIILALVLGAVPLVMLRNMIGAPQVWCYILFPLHLGSGIAVYYVLKLVQDKLVPGFTKHWRAIGSSAVVFVGMGWLGITGTVGRLERHGEADLAAKWLKGIIKPGDRVYSKFPWDAPFEFYLHDEGMDPSVATQGPRAGANSYVLVGPTHGQSLAVVLTHHDLTVADTSRFQLVKDWKLLEIYATH